VNNGRVAEQGTHEELLQRGGMYLRFIEAEQGKHSC
jgi:ABC-type multidrug transport system fused ATPase/permease subunit